MYCIISIHAPTRGATYAADVAFSWVVNISIHAPTRGATVLVRSGLRLSRYFNPRSHERSDKLFVAVKVWYPIFQSTLPREERRLRIGAAVEHFYFNPRSHERSDKNKQKVTWMQMKFQSTLPREERQCVLVCIKQILNFNPRSHERSDESQSATRLCHS